MKFSRAYVLAILAFLVLVFLAEYRMPRRFNWQPSFSPGSTQPFGCKLFDSVLAQTLPQGYMVTDQTLYQLKTDSAVDSTRRQAVMVLAEDLYYLEDIDVETLLDMAQRGDKLLLVGERFSQLLVDTLKFWEVVEWQSLSLVKHAQQHQEHDTLRWLADGCYGERLFRFYPHLVAHAVHVDPDSIAFRPLSARGETHDWLAVEYPVGKGCIIVATTPLLFTNYGILESDGCDYVLRLLNEVKDLPVVRTTAYLPVREEAVEESPLRYLLARRPLRWALYLTMLTLVVFLLTATRRRQRAIPVVAPPANKSQEFVSLIATLYQQRKDYRDLALKKSAYFAETLRRELHADVGDPADDDHTLSLLAHQTGIDRDELAALLSDLRRLQEDETQITYKTMADYIQRMDAVVSKLR